MSIEKILILGTGNAQKDIIEYCKKNGFFVVAESYSAGDSAQDIADSFFQTNITDIERTKC